MGRYRSKRSLHRKSRRSTKFSKDNSRGRGLCRRLNIRQVRGIHRTRRTSCW
nr:MAG TPA_asm: hypothetical protein [Bacteriophage sp.]